MKILIKNCNIITSDKNNMLIKNGNIGIIDKFIEFADDCKENVEKFIPDKIIDGTDKIVMPGLINTHTHSAMTILRNYAGDTNLEDWLFNHIFPAEACLTEEDIYWGTMLGIAEMIKSGTTNFADMYIHMDQVAKAISDTKIRATISNSPIRLGTGKEEFDKTIEFYKRWHNNENDKIKVFIEVHSVYLFKEEQLVKAANLAKELNTGIHIHILETAFEKEESKRKYGMSSIEICEKTGIFNVPVIAAHCVHLSDSDIEIIKNKNINIAHNPTSNLKLGSGIARVPDMLAKGINVCLGTDGAASNNNLNMFEEMNLVALIHKGYHMNPMLINAEQTILMGTINGAKALGQQKEIGMIKKGMKADLIIVDTSEPHFTPINDYVASIVYSAQASDVETVILDGDILMENRELLTIDIEKVKSKVKEIAKRVLNL